MECNRPLKINSLFIYKARISLIKSIFLDVKGKGKFKLLLRKFKAFNKNNKEYTLTYKGIKFIATDNHGLRLLSIPYYEPRVYNIISSTKGNVFIDIVLLREGMFYLLTKILKK